MEGGGRGAGNIASKDELKDALATLEELQRTYASLKSQGKDMSMERELLHRLEQVKKKLRSAAATAEAHSTADSTSKEASKEASTPGGKGVASAAPLSASKPAASAAKALFAHGPVSQCDFMHGLGVRASRGLV